jgi:hypothetical protein
VSSQGRRPRPPSFSDVARSLPCGSGDTRRAALHPSVQPQCWFLPLAWVCPTVMPIRTPHHSTDCSAGCIVRIDRHGSKDRAKDASLSACDDLSCLRRVHALCGACRRRSPPRRPSDIRCHRRAVLQRRIPLQVDGPTEALVPTTPREERRLPEDQDAFHRHDTRRNLESRRDCSLRPSRRLSRSRRPHVVPRLGRVLLIGHCKVTVRSPAGP